MPNEIEQLKTRITELETLVGGIVRQGEYIFNKNVHFGAGTKILGSIYPGSVASDGSAINLPNGWSSTKTATGKYTITHNLNSTRYVVSASPNQNLATEHDVTSKTSTTFKLETRLDLAFADCGIDFLLMIY